MKEYRDWKKIIKAHEIIHELQPHETAMKIYLARKGDAKRALKIVKPQDLQRPDALEIIYKALDSV